MKHSKVWLCRSLILVLPVVLILTLFVPLPHAAAQDDDAAEDPPAVEEIPAEEPPAVEDEPAAPDEPAMPEDDATVQDDDTGEVPGVMAAPPGSVQLSAEQVQQASALISEAFTLAERNPSARVMAVRGAAALLPRLEGGTRLKLRTRWMRLAMSASVPRHIRSNAFSAFFDVASRTDLPFALSSAPELQQDAAARAGAFVAISEAAERTDWQRADEYAMMAQRAARLEPNLLARARALTFVGHRMVVVNPERSEAAIIEASSHIRQMRPSRERDYLLAELVGAAAKYDLALARRITSDISHPGLQGLATARVNIAEISQTTLTTTTADRIAALAKAAAPYDIRAVPILIQLPPEPDVLKALSDALPAIRHSGQSPVPVSLLERMWEYAGRAEASTYRDQLQSRLARLMVLQDMWRGRDWGKQLSWQGGRVQVGAFLQAVAAARRSTLRAAPLQDLAARNVNRAIFEARTMTPAGRVEALLLIAGQVLG